MANQNVETDEDNLYGIDTHKITVPFKCKQCIFLKKDSIYGKPCEKLGILPDSDPCIQINQDPAQLSIYGNPYIKTLVEAAGHVKRQDIIKVIALLYRSVRSQKKSDLRMGQPVVIRLISDDYLNNYARGMVVGMAKENLGTEREYSKDQEGRPVAKNKRKSKEVILIQGKKGWVARVYRGAVLTMEDWKKKKAELIAADKINDPKSLAPAIKKKRALKYEPPTIDDDLNALVTKKKKRKKIKDLSDMVSLRVR